MGQSLKLPQTKEGFLLWYSASPRDQAAETTVLKVGEGSSDNTELKVS